MTARQRRAFVLSDALAVLERTPGTLDSLLRGLPDDWLNSNEGEKTWSPADVVGHLIHADQTNWLPRVKVILEHGEARPFDEFKRFGHVEKIAGRPVGELLDQFAQVRSEMLARLTRLNLTGADLDRRGGHPSLGRVTLGELLAAWTVHDLDHLMQITRVLARQYTDAVGPWRDYLRIVRDEVR